MSRYNAQPVESAEALPSFCSDCGRRLIIEDRTDGFDPRTGTPRLVAYAHCRGSWLDRLFGDDFHDSYVVSPRPDIPPRLPFSVPINDTVSRAEARREP